MALQSETVENYGVADSRYEPTYISHNGSFKVLQNHTAI